jgi:hypothetical protein
MSLTPKKSKVPTYKSSSQKNIGMHTVAEIGYLNDVYSFYHVIEIGEEYWRIVGENINTGRFLREDEYTDKSKAAAAWERVEKSVANKNKERVKKLKKQLYRRRLTLQNTRGKQARSSLLWKIKNIKKEIALYESE